MYMCMFLDMFIDAATKPFPPFPTFASPFPRLRRELGTISGP